MHPTTWLLSNIQKLDTPSFDVSVNYTFDDGKQSSFYDYGFIERKSENEAPDRKTAKAVKSNRNTASPGW